MQALRGMVTTTCCERLELMRDLMKSATSSRVDLHSKRFYGQPMPVLIDGTAVSPMRFEITIEVRVGSLQYWVNMVLDLRGSAWICTYLDMG